MFFDWIPRVFQGFNFLDRPCSRPTVYLLDFKIDYFVQKKMSKHFQFLHTYKECISTNPAENNQVPANILRIGPKSISAGSAGEPAKMLAPIRLVGVNMSV